MRYMAGALTVLAALFAEAPYGQVVFDTVPQNLQFFARDRADGDSAVVIVSGRVTATGHTAIHVDVSKAAGAPTRYSNSLVYNGEAAPFHIATKIHAELAEYRYTVYLESTQITERARIVCGDAYLLTGQSNGVFGHGTGAPEDQYLRSYGGWAKYNFTELTWRADNEFGGICALTGELIVSMFHVPVFMLNGSKGGAPIADFIPNINDHGDTNTLYGQWYYNAVQSGLKDKFRAVILNQGEEDGGIGTTNWGELVDSLYRTKWNVDFPTLEQVYIFQINTDCGGSNMFREYQRRVSGMHGMFTVVPTIGSPGFDGCHYGGDGYWEMSQRLFYAMARDLYGSTDTEGVTAPNVIRAYCSESTSPLQVFVEFDQPVVWPSDTLGRSLRDHFFFFNRSGFDFAGRVIQGEAQGNTVVLTLSAGTPKPDTAGCVDLLYPGPYITNPRGIPALTFWALPVSQDPTTGMNHGSTKALQAIEITASPNPFNPAVKISSKNSSINSQYAEIRVFNVQGKQVFMLSTNCSLLSAGITWDASDQPSGAYIIHAMVNGKAMTKRVVLMK